jgi:hypothetical protein
MTTAKFLGLGHERAEAQAFILVRGYRTAYVINITAP